MLPCRLGADLAGFVRQRCSAILTIAMPTTALMDRRCIVLRAYGAAAIPAFLVQTLTLLIPML